MWGESLAVLCVAVASALVPVINIEAILVLAASQGQLQTWLLVTLASVGQVLGKLVWYVGGRELERFRFVARRMDRPRAKAAMTRWRARTEGRPWSCAGALLLSAATGFPPYAVLAVVAGALRVPLPVFLVTGLLGRAVRFWAVIGGTTAVLSWW